jgi:hypothetical protein
VREMIGGAGESINLVFICSLACNLIKKHPNVKQIIHRSTHSHTLMEKNVLEEAGEEIDSEEEKEEEKFSGYIRADCYDDKEEDPQNTNALDSFLWELLPLERHYQRTVQRAAKLFSTNFMGKNALPTEEMLSFTESDEINNTLFKELDKTDGRSFFAYPKPAQPTEPLKYPFASSFVSEVSIFRRKLN